MTERREGLYKERVDKYEKLKSIDADTKTKLVGEFKYGARQLSQVDSWIGMTRFYSTGFLLATIVLFCVTVPPMVGRSFPHLEGWGVKGLRWWALELLLSTLTGALAVFVIFLPIYFLVGSGDKLNEFFNSSGLILFWATVLLPVACTYLYALRVGRFVASPWPFSHRLVFYCVIQAGFLMPLFLALAMPFRLLGTALRNRRLSLNTRAVIVDELLDLLDIIEQPNYEKIWTEFSHRTWLTKRLEVVASCIEIYFPRFFLTGVQEMDRWTDRNTSEMANGVRELIKWVVVPTPHTREDFKARITKYVTAALASDWGKFDRVPAEKLSPKQGLKDRVASAVAALLTAAVPILLLLLLKRMKVVVAEPLLTYLTVGAYVWAALSLLSRLDPQYAAKLGALKDLTKTLPFGKKGGNDG